MMKLKPVVPFMPSRCLTSPCLLTRQGRSRELHEGLLWEKPQPNRANINHFPVIFRSMPGTAVSSARTCWYPLGRITSPLQYFVTQPLLIMFLVTTMVWGGVGGVLVVFCFGVLWGFFYLLLRYYLRKLSHSTRIYESPSCILFQLLQLDYGNIKIACLKNEIAEKILCSKSNNLNMVC